MTTAHAATAATTARPSRRLADVLIVVITAAVLPLSGLAASERGDPRCEPGGDVVELEGVVAPVDARSYRLLPVEVAEGTTRIEVGYAWEDHGPGGAPPLPSTPLTQTVFDLGLWDTAGPFAAEGFRGWSGSRQGKLHTGQRPIFVQVDTADRSYAAGPIDPGTWHVELGIAAVGPGGASWRVEVACFDPAVGEPPVPDPVDPQHVSSPEPGWYHGDFHAHGFHSSPGAPSSAEFVQHARDAQLDFLPVTEYVVGWHWDELGETQREHPDVLLWPGREIITYFGHAITLGETRGVIEYRHGFEGISMADIQQDVIDAGGLFQVAHPTTFSGPLFRSFCRGCEYELDEVTDWSLVDTIEVLTGPVIVDPSQLGGPATPVGMENPFLREAIDLWEDLLQEGHKITAVSGSDDKAGPGIGSSATAVYAEELSRSALTDGLRAGHAYIRTRGVAESPALDVRAVTADGQEGIWGDTLDADEAEVTVSVTGGSGQVLKIVRDGHTTDLVPITDDDFAHTFTATRSSLSGPLGTFWRVETLDAHSRTTISNPIFLAPPDGG
jgi:hypothetical protein